VNPRRHHAERILRDAVEAGSLGRAEASWLCAHLADGEVRGALLEGAAESKRRAVGDRVTVSRNVFIPLTNLCRDRCAYCTFAKTPDSPDAKTLSLEEVARVVEGGVRTGCSEALFCLGDKPEIAYRGYREWLRRQGFGSTAEYLLEGCRVAVEGGLLPHTNAGILSQREMERLRPVNASMGLMLESTSPRLRGPGMAHRYAPDKDPRVRIRMHEQAGELRIPFTTGMLLGIGENDEERIDTLFEIRRLHERHGHIQEAIIQPFHPKPGTPMRAVPPLSDPEVIGWVALARLVLGREIEVQAPPNLASGLVEALLGAGLSDWGGVSPVTVDFINPEAPWPTLAELRRRTEAAGQRLVERLPIYPRYLRRPELLDPALREAVLRLASDEGYARARASLEAA
jgi:7,8-didemethyl-8-hydroxy-5-deazariboflavin synthase CofG subunit